MKHRDKSLGPEAVTAEVQGLVQSESVQLKRLVRKARRTLERGLTGTDVTSANAQCAREILHHFRGFAAVTMKYGRTDAPNSEGTAGITQIVRDAFDQNGRVPATPPDFDYPPALGVQEEPA